MKLNIPFQQLLKLIKSLTPSQKGKLLQKLTEETSSKGDKDDFIEYLLNGPTYSEKDLQLIEENRKSITTWRTKN